MGAALFYHLLPIIVPHYSTSITDVNVTTNTTLDFSLPPIYNLFGFVIDSNGAGVADVSVSASTSCCIPFTYNSTPTALDGSYSLPLYQETYDIQLSFGGTTYTAETGLALNGSTSRDYTLFNP